LLKLWDIGFNGLPDLFHIQLQITVRSDIPDANDLDSRYRVQNRNGRKARLERQ
jgi:hypothetical protein